MAILNEGSKALVKQCLRRSNKYSYKRLRHHQWTETGIDIRTTLLSIISAYVPNANNVLTAIRNCLTNIQCSMLVGYCLGPNPNWTLFSESSQWYAAEHDWREQNLHWHRELSGVRLLPCIRLLCLLMAYNERWHIVSALLKLLC